MTTKLSSGFHAARSTADGIEGIIAELTATIQPETTKLLSVFFSSRHKSTELAAALQKAYPDSLIIGCTTAGELTHQGFTEQGVSAMGLDGDIVARAAVAVAENCTNDATPIRSALTALVSELNVDVNRLNSERYLGLVLTDGNAGHEEFVMDTLAAEAFSLPFVGGSAGDDLAFQKSFVIHAGKAFTNSAVLVLMETKRPFTILKTQSFRPTGKVWEVTKADVRNRIVYEFDGRPAAEVYGEALGIAESDIEERFMSNPIGLLVGSDPYVRSPQRREGASAIRFFCQVSEGSRVHLLEGGDMIADTKKDLAEARKNLGSLSGMLVFNCILRYLDAKRQGITDALGGCYGEVPAAGFNTYGEQYLGHINQTATIVCFA